MNSEIQKIYDEFLLYLESEDKEMAVKFILDKLKNKDIDVVKLYTEVLAPSLNNMLCKIDEKGVCIWKEHIRSSTIRTIIECAYPYVMDERKEKFGDKHGEKVVIVCPTEEYHEIGARMGADFYTLCGYDAIFVGSNTPKGDFLEAINFVKPNFVVISVTNFYNLVAAKKAIDLIKSKNNEVKIIASGYAFKANNMTYKNIGADYFVDSFEDIKALDGRNRK